MAKWHGDIAFANTIEIEPGIWQDAPAIVKEYQGDVLRSTSKYGPDNLINEDLKVSVRISIVADPFAKLNFNHIKYITYMGISWNVTDIEFLYPRMILTLGGVCTDEGS